MNKKISRYVILISVIAAIILSVSVFLCIGNAEKKMKQYSFNELAASTRALADECAETVNRDESVLSAMAALIGMQEPSDMAGIMKIMNSVNLSNTFISHIEILTPDNKLIKQDGEIADASGIVNFSDEIKKGSYISDKCTDIFNEDESVLYNSVPIVHGGQHVAILRGVLSLTKVAKTHSFKFYDGKGFIIIVNGDTGDVFLDTGSGSLSNFSTLSDRKMLIGSYDEAAKNMLNGKSGDVAFVSKNTNNTLYLHYEPIGVNNWSIVLGLGEEKALAGTRESIKSLYVMAVIIGLVLLLHMGLIVWNLFAAYETAYKMSIIDQSTELHNRSAYERYLLESENTVYPDAVCVYTDVNGLHELNNRFGHAAGDKMLKIVADYLQRYFPGAKLYRIGGDEFVAFSMNAGEDECRRLMELLANELREKGYSISYGISAHKNETGLRRLVREADEQMLLHKKEHYAGNENRDNR